MTSAGCIQGEGDDVRWSTGGRSHYIQADHRHVQQLSSESDVESVFISPFNVATLELLHSR